VVLRGLRHALCLPKNNCLKITCHHPQHARI
jgi:hypothetical protein